MKEIEIRFDAKGMRFIYDDRATNLLKLGTCTIRRASNVEPTEDNQWMVDFTPVVPGTKLGPFKTREQALQEEVKWLKEHKIPKPKAH